MRSTDVSTDVLIIGSGVAGALCAYRLAQKGVKVTILEAGPRIKREDIVTGFRNSPYLDLSAGYPNTPWAPRPDWGTGKDRYIEQIGPDVSAMEYLRLVGGTSWHWSANSIRLLPSDFQMHTTRSVGLDWPISYSDLEPYYTEAEYEMGVAGDDSADTGSPRSKPYPNPPIPPSYSDRILSEKLRSLGMSFIARPAARNSRTYDGRSQCQGFGTCSPICPTGAQYSAMVHIQKAEKLGVELIENARADRINTDNHGGIVSVDYTHSDGTQGSATGKIVVVAANGIETPRLLLMSASDEYPHGLANSSGEVGRNYMDHPGLSCRMLSPDPLYVDRGPESTITSFTYRAGDFQRERAAWTMSIYNRSFFHKTTLNSLREGVLPPDLDELIMYRSLHEVEFDVHLEQLPNHQNGITLDWSKKDSAGQPVMRFHYSLGGYERNGLKFAQDIFWKISNTLQSTETQISETYSHHHLMGTTRMGDKPLTSVVDHECRTHDHKNMFLLGSAVFPTCGTANPTLTIAALSLRAADHIKHQLMAD